MTASSGTLTAAPGIRPATVNPVRLRGTRCWPRLSSPSASGGLRHAVLSEVRGSSLIPLRFQAEQTPRERKRKTRLLSPSGASGRKGSAGVAIMGPRNESRTRRPSVKTIEPRQGRVNERSTGSEPEQGTFAMSRHDGIVPVARELAGSRGRRKRRERLAPLRFRSVQNHRLIAAVWPTAAEEAPGSGARPAPDFAAGAAARLADRDPAPDEDASAAASRSGRRGPCGDPRGDPSASP